MPGVMKQVLLGISLIAGVSGMTTHAALAGSLSGATLGGTAPYLLYDSNGTYTYTNPSASLSGILTGNSGNPTGNVELFANSEQSPIYPGTSATPAQAFNAFYNFLGYNQFTSLSGQLGGKTITLSSLTAADWFGDAAVNTARQGIANASLIPNSANRALALSAAITPLYNPSNLATRWFNETLSRYGVTSNQSMFTMFLLAGGFQRFSDPNIAYVNQDPDGLIRIGLAGHYDAAALLKLRPDPNHPIQASELVKVMYGDQPPQYLYNFLATNSKQHNNETLGKSGSGYNGQSDHSGNYELTLVGEPPASIPEPSVILGLITLGGLLTFKHKVHKS